MLRSSPAAFRGTNSNSCSLTTRLTLVMRLEYVAGPWTDKLCSNFATKWLWRGMVCRGSNWDSYNAYATTHMSALP